MNRFQHTGPPLLFSRRTLTIILLVTLGCLPSLAFHTSTVHASSTANVAIVDYRFLPPRLNTTTGTMVIWTYALNGGDIHTVTSNNTTSNGSPVFQSTNPNPLHPGQSYSHTFNQPGNYAYYCAVHPTLMNAWVNVTGSPVTPPSSNPPPANNSPADFTAIIIAGGTVAGAALSLIGVFVYRARKKNPGMGNSCQPLLAPSPCRTGNDTGFFDWGMSATFET